MVNLKIILLFASSTLRPSTTNWAKGVGYVLGLCTHYWCTKHPIAHRHDATMWTDLAMLNCFIAHNFCAVMLALYHSDIRAIDPHPFMAIFHQSHFVLTLPNMHNSTQVSHLFLVLLDQVGHS